MKPPITLMNHFAEVHDPRREQGKRHLLSDILTLTICAGRQRRSPRLQGYDYSQSGAYFVTICTHERAHLFGVVADGEMVLNRAGEIAQERWFALPDHHNGIELDAFVVMPNHIHGIIILTGIVGTGPALSGQPSADNAGVV
ncbi:MAG: transposase family protein, partial [Anaerolineae bacterium]|nr:transposase family protein [Anaerolineae bacterium]